MRFGFTMVPKFFAPERSPIFFFFSADLEMLRFGCHPGANMLFASRKDFFCV
jgi:hypothetical protein